MRQLFSPREAKEASQRQTEERIQLLSFLTGEEARLKKSLNSLNDEFDATLRRQREVYAAEKDKMQEELSQLDADIHTRKEARRKLMEPIDAIEARAIAKEKQAEEIFAKANEKLVSAQELIHKTTSKLTVLQEKEDILDSEAKAIASKRESIDEESEMVSAGHKRLNDEIAAFRATSSAVFTTLAEKEGKFKAESRARTVLLDEREKSLSRREAAVEAEKKRLVDERGVLDRAWAELRSKQ